MYFNPYSRKFVFCCFQKEKKGERETLIGCFLNAPELGNKPTTWVCALTGNQTRNLSVKGWCSNQLSHTSQGKGELFF